MTVANPERGDVTLTIDGREQVLRLTLGALASLEARLGSDSLIALAERFEGGKIRASDLVALLAAGLSGAGSTIDEETLVRSEIEGGTVAAMQAGVALLTRTFRPLDHG